MKKINLSIITGFLMLLCLAAKAQMNILPSDSRIIHGKLENGLTYFICKNQKPEKRVELRLAVNAGSVQEDSDQLGMAHLVEHMCFDGTKHFPKKDIIHYLQSIGASFGPDINAFTSFDETVYKLTIPSDSSHIVNQGLQILQDWAENVSFDTSAIRNERNVVLEEWRLRLGAYDRMQKQYIPILLKGSKYAKHIPIGTKESILTTPAENIKQFYKNWYRPDLMAVIVVGDIDPDTILNKIKTLFSPIPIQKNERFKDSTFIEQNSDPLICIVKDKENTGTHITLAIKTKHQPFVTEHDYLNKIILSMICSMLNQRLSEKTNVTDPPYINAWASYGNLWVRNLEGFQLNLSTTEENVLKGLSSVLQEMQSIKQFGFTANELSRTKKIFLNIALNTAKESDKQNSSALVSNCVSGFLNNHPIIPAEYLNQFLHNYQDSIQLKTINKLFRSMLIQKNEVAIITGMEKEKFSLPSENEIKSLLESQDSMHVEPYNESLKDSLLMKRPAHSGRIILEKKDTLAGITEYNLSNGIKVILKPTRFQNAKIMMDASCSGGSSLYSSEFKLSSRFATSLVEESGLSHFSKEDLHKILAGKSVSVHPFISDLTSGFSGSCETENLESMFQLLYLYFTAPRWSDTAYASLIERNTSIYKNVLSNPENYFDNEVQFRRYRNNPDAPGVYPNEHDWQNLSLQKAKKVFHENFSNANGFTFIFTGSFEEKQIRPMIETYLGTLPYSNTKRKYRDLGLKTTPGPQNVAIFKGTEPKCLIFLAFSGSTKWSSKESYYLESLGNILQRILTDKLREEMHNIYGFGLNAEIDRFPSAQFNFSMTIPCASEHADTLVAAVISEIIRIQKNGITSEEFQKEIESQRRSLEKNLKENSWWLYYLDDLYNIEKNPSLADHPDSYRKLLTPKEIQQVAIKYLHTNKLIRYTLYPENENSK